MNTTFKQNLIRKKIGKKEMGLFAAVDFPKGSIILEFHGPIINKDKLPNPLKIEDDHYLQINKELFIGPSGDVDDCVRHSCTPNCGVFIVGNRALLKSIMLIKKGMEITFDYATTSSDTKEEWNINCSCPSFNCRKKISGFNSLDEKTKERYKTLGIIPAYLMEKK